MAIATLIADDAAFGFPGYPVFEHVSVQVSAGQRLAVAGENGAGKTTLLRVLAGELEPQRGEIRRQGSVAVVGQQMEVLPGQTVGDLVQDTLSGLRDMADKFERATADFDHQHGLLNDLSELLAAAEHLAVWDADRRIVHALSRLGACTDRSRELATLSVGQRHRVRLACRLAERADILLLDEPTNHLDDSGIDYLSKQIAAWRGVVVLVTHDRKLLDETATSILDLDPAMDGRPVLHGQPGYLTYRFAKNQALQRWRQRYRSETQRQQVLWRHRDRAYEGLSDEWRPPKGSQKHRRATRARIHVKAGDRLMDKLAAEAVDIPVPPLELSFPDLPAMAPDWPSGAGQNLVEVRSPRVPQRLDLPGTRIAVQPSGRLLITGPNGSGKSTLLQVLAGTLESDRSARVMLTGARVGVLGQEGAASASGVSRDGFAEQVKDGASGFDMYALLARRLLTSGALDPDQLVPVAFLGLLTEEDLDRPLQELSVGQRRRFDLACALLAAPHLLLLDEPTNHLSIDLMDDLTLALQRTSAAVVIATHDRRMRADYSHWPTVDLG